MTMDILAIPFMAPLLLTISAFVLYWIFIGIVRYQEKHSRTKSR